MKVPHHATNFLFLFLFVQKGTPPVHAIRLEEDMTKYLDSLIGSLFKNVHGVQALSATMRWFNFSRDSMENKYNKIQPLKVVSLKHLESSDNPIISHKGVQLQWNFTENKIHIHSEENIFAVLLQTYKQIDYFNVIKFKNLTCMVNCSELLNCSESNEFSCEFSYNKSLSPTYINKTELTWIYNPNTEELHKQIQSLIFPMARRSIISYLKPIRDSYLRARNRLIASLPNFASDPQQCHYLIPRHRLSGFAMEHTIIKGRHWLSGFTMEHIIIKGLSDIDSLKFISPLSGEDKFTLVFRNIEGELTLNYERDNVPPLKMNFKLDGFSITQSISVDRNTTGSQKDTSLPMNSISGKSLRFWILSVDTMTLLSDRQMEAMKNGIEVAIVSSIFYDDETVHIEEGDFKSSLKDTKTTNTSDSEAIRKEAVELINSI